MKPYRFLSIIVPVLFLLSCTRTEESFLSVIEEVIEVPAEGGTYEIHVSSNTQWSLTSYSEWITFEYPDSFTEEAVVVVNVAENDQQSARNGLLTVTIPEFSETVTFVQEAPVVSLTGHSIDIDASSRIITIDLQSNIRYSCEIVEGNDWIEEITSKSLQTYTHSFSVSENTDRTSREALIVFESENTGIREEFKVIQSGKLSVLKIWHENISYAVPYFTGEDISGTVEWGDGQKEDYAASTTGHTYQDSGTKEVTFTLSNAESFRIDCVDGIRRIDLSAF